MSFVMRDGVMGTSQNNSKKKGFYVMPRLTNDEVTRRCKEKHGNKYLYEYDSTSVSDLQKLNCWLSKNKAFYKCNARVWSKVDVKKRRTAAQNNLRYVVFWDNALSDFDAWVESGMPVRYDWK